MQFTRKMILQTYRQPEAECMVELEFDLERALKYLGNKAWGNKSKRAKLGYCKVTVRPTRAGAERVKELGRTHTVARPWWLERA